MARGPGGGQKVNFLREFISKVEDGEIFVFTDNYDVIANDYAQSLLAKYRRYYDGKVVFGGETACWPKSSLASQYPEPPAGVVTKYLNSGVFMGYARDIKKLVSVPIDNSADDQLYYTLAFLQNQEDVVLDYKCRLFLCLSGMQETDLQVDKPRGCLYYKGERPVFVHGNGPDQVKVLLNTLTSYCLRDKDPPDDIRNKRILYVVHEKDTDDNNAVLAQLLDQDYPRHLINVLLVYTTESCRKRFELGLSEEGVEFSVIKNDGDAWSSIITHAQNIEYQYLFYQDTTARITNRNCLATLLAYNKMAIAPMLTRKGAPYANFWGSVSGSGYYKRSDNYLDIVNRYERGCWNVPYVTHAFMLERSLINENLDKRNGQPYSDTDMVICSNIRSSFWFMYVLNTEEYGELL